MAEVSGYAIQWNQPAIIAGLFEERFARGAFNQSLIDNPDIAALWAHDTSRPLARVANKSLTLRSDNIGLWYSFTPDEKSPLGQEVLASVGSGLVNEVSVGFSSIEEEWDDSGSLPKRLITRAWLSELSIVLWGAYGKSTSASLSGRSTGATRAEAAMKARGLPV
ncbi:HK97 family phage prohead protease [Rhizobium sophoriradicis]|uniref:HK97 family phage prohead protease n=1 Tax=Rhizobium sophoriradicis TaxID=1535245 RepID=UPI00098FCBCB|nr:HK97 family phage prohead protease [Rhizobium sophoriradicis]RSC01896.1 HK97 family phage prohead protease [Rhizobium sophoriradicis]